MIRLGANKPLIFAAAKTVAPQTPLNLSVRRHHDGTGLSRIHESLAHLTTSRPDTPLVSNSPARLTVSIPRPTGGGSNVIRAADVRDAVLYRVRQGLIPGSVLAVPTPEDTCQFGLTRGRTSSCTFHFPYAFAIRCSASLCAWQPWPISHGLSTDPSRSPNPAIQWPRQAAP